MLWRVHTTCVANCDTQQSIYSMTIEDSSISHLVGGLSEVSDAEVGEVQWINKQSLVLHNSNHIT